MKFGKLEDISGVDFSLPETPDVYFNAPGEVGGMRVFVGCPMWGNKNWTGILYPKGTKPTEYLSLYSRAFNTIELNTTHYRIPEQSTVLSWKEQAAAGFVFCPKIPQSISHYRKLVNCEEELTLFCDAIALLEEKLGCSFVQLHDSFGPGLMDHLRRFLKKWPRELPLSIEFRHEAWFSENRLLPEAADLLAAHGVAAVITDVAGRRDVLHTTLTATQAVLRFVGNALHPSDYTRSEAWITQFAQWKALGIKEIYFFVHEPDDAAAPEMGAFVIDKLNERFHLGLANPLLSGQSGQMSLF